MTKTTHHCPTCIKPFQIATEDELFYKNLKVPTPQSCPSCREHRRLAWRNEQTLYNHTCARTGKPIISYIAPESPIPVYSLEEWFAPNWDARDYGRPIDFTRPFFPQFRELLEKTPHIPLLVGDSENSPYTNFGWCNKNSYMISAADFNEDCFYSGYLFHSRDCCDCLFVENSELCYECVDCEKCYDCNYCQQCKNSNNCWYCEDCVGCNECIGCINLRQTKHQILNHQYSPEEYKELKQRILTNPSLIAQPLLELRQKEPVRATQTSKSENCTGNNLHNCKNCFNCFDLLESEDCRYVTYGTNARDCMDVNGAPETELQYECVACPSSYNLRFCSSCWVKSSYLTYCHLCRASQNCFGCVGLYRNEYCILNKQYSREEYEKLVLRLIEHMRQTGEWGEFFPIEISPFKYEDTVGKDYYPKLSTQPTTAMYTE